MTPITPGAPLPLRLPRALRAFALALSTLATRLGAATTLFLLALMAGCTDAGDEADDAASAMGEATEEAGQALEATLGGEDDSAEAAMSEAGEELGEAAAATRRAAEKAAEDAGDEVEEATDG